jgi:FMN-dependent NADH-azoreductase
MKVLHIIATPRAEKSNTLQVSTVFLDRLSEHRQDIGIEVVNLFHADLPGLAGDNIDAKYTLMVEQPIEQSQESSWRRIDTRIEHFLSADAHVTAREC